MAKINILEHIYECSNDAHNKLKIYLQQIESKFSYEPEIIKDIELGIIEQLDTILSQKMDQILTLIDIEFLIQKMGAIEMFDEVLEENIKPNSQDTSHTNYKSYESGRYSNLIATQNLYRDYENKLIAGVCAGIAAYFNISSWIVRIMFLLCFFTPLPVVIPYLLMWFLIPPAKTKSEQLNMRGIPVNIDTIVNNNKYTRTKIINLAKLVATSCAFIVFIILSIILAVSIF